MSTWTLPDRLVPLDRRLIDGVQETLARAARLAESHLSCRVGCIHCCIGPFDITPLDAARLDRGIKTLETQAAERIRRRARRQWDAMRGGFPGDPRRGVLAEDDAARERFFAAFERYACPVLDPATGGCLLYEARPISCRTFGYPLPTEGRIQPPCVLNFQTLNVSEMEPFHLEVDPEDLEGAILAELRDYNPRWGDTVIAAVLGNSEE